MAVSSIIQRGYGSWGGVNLLPTLGYGIGAAPGTSGAFYFAHYVLSGVGAMPRLVLANTATAAYRRCYFHLVDATDGITAETGEASGQPQISTNGGAWTNTGIGTLTSIGNGRYYADLTQAAVATAGDIIETRYKSANTAECPGDTFQVVAFNPNSASDLGLSNLDATISSRLAPTTSGRTLDVTSTGEAGIDWANIGSPTATVNFSGTTFAQLSGDVAGKILGGGVSTITGTGVRAVDSSGAAIAPAATALSTATWTGTRAGYLDNLSGGAVALASGVSVASGGITSASFASGAITATAIAADAIGASELASDAIAEIVAGVHTTAMTESYPTDGSTATPAQALYLLLQKVGESTVPGTVSSTVTQTVKKLDGSTSAATYTISLDASGNVIGSTRAS